jgi:hypothetical protein
MPLTAAELTVELQETNRRLTDAINGLRTEVTELRKDAGWVIKIGSSIGGTLLACMLGILGFAYRVDQRASRTEEAVIALQANFAEFKEDFKARDKQFADSLAAIQKDSRARDGLLDRALESLDRIEKALAQNRPAKPAPE